MNSNSYDTAFGPALKAWRDESRDAAGGRGGFGVLTGNGSDAVLPFALAVIAPEPARWRRNRAIGTATAIGCHDR